MPKKQLLAAVLFGFSVSVADAQTAQQAPVLVRNDEIRVSRQAHPGEPFLSIPIQHTRTGILQNDLHADGGSIRRSLFAPAGSRALWLGRFVPRRSRDSDDARDLWCFVRPNEAPSINRCTWGRDTVFVNPLYATEIENSIRTGFHRVLTEDPIILEGPVEIAPDLRLVYVFSEWRDGELHYRENGGAIGTAQLEPDGSAAIQTPIGPIRLTRGDDSDEAIIVAPTGNGTYRWANLDQTILELRTNALRTRPHPIVVATTRLEPDAELRPIEIGATLLEQEIRPAMIWRSAQRLRDGLGGSILRPGDLLAAHESGDGQIACPIGHSPSTSCVRDGDGVAGFEINYSVVRQDASALFLRRVTQTYPIDPVRLEPVSDAAAPNENLRLSYLGTADSEGASYARFTWTGGSPPDAAQTTRAIIATRLDEHGAAILTTDTGEPIGEFRVVDGRPHFRRLGGIPTHPAQVIDRDDEILEMRRKFEERN